MTQKSLKQKRFAVIALLLWFALAWSWTLSTDSLSLSGSRWQGLAIAAVVSVVNVSISAAVIWQTGKAVWKLYSAHKAPQAVALSLLLFAFADFLVAWLTAIIWIGPEGSVDNVLPLGSPSLLLIHTPFGYAARIIGFYGLAAFGWLLILLLANARTRRKIAPYTLSLLSLISFAGWLLYQTPTGDTVQAKIVNESLDARIRPVNPSEATFVLFPEYGLDELNANNIHERIHIDKNNPVKFIGSEQLPLDNETAKRNTLIFGDAERGIVSKQDKHRLIPGGEDLPYIIHVGLIMSRQKGTIDYFNFAKKIKKGDAPLRPLSLDSQTAVGAAVCSSIISPEDYRRLTNAGATILTNSASLGVFRGSSVFSWQQKSLARFMAMANARYFLQSANDSASYTLNDRGQTIAETSKPEVLSVQAHNSTRKTLYTTFGEWMAVSGAATVFVLAVLPKIRKKMRSIPPNS